MNYAENNKAIIIGSIATPFVYSHTSYGEDFYTTDIATQRESGVVDYVPIMISERLTNVKEELIGTLVRLEGSFRSRNTQTDLGRKLSLFLFVADFEIIEDGIDLLDRNMIKLHGYICKQPSYRKTPLGREIADVCLAVNINNNKSSYIPCVCWGRNARYVGSLDVGTELSFLGRIQSRQYEKHFENGTVEQRTAYEVSVQLVEV